MTTDIRNHTFLDEVFAEIGRALQVLDGSATASRPNPAGKMGLMSDTENGTTAELTAEEMKHAAGLMRVNHVGEICAQALYRGQALFCGDAAIKELLLQAAVEEVDHLVWCNDRLKELSSRPSIFNPLWYAGSLALGMIASKAGTPYNMGFMAETERQVEEHLNSHLETLPAHDIRSRVIVEQMRDDEIEHRTTAENNGAVTLPMPIKLAMRAMAKVMTTAAYRI